MPYFQGDGQYQTRSSNGIVFPKWSRRYISNAIDFQPWLAKGKVDGLKNPSVMDHRYPRQSCRCPSNLQVCRLWYMRMHIMLTFCQCLYTMDVKEHYFSPTKENLSLVLTDYLLTMGCLLPTVWLWWLILAIISRTTPEMIVFHSTCSL